MAWIESHQGLARHLKTKRLARKLEVSVPAAIGHLHLLWWWSLDNTPDGNLSQLEAEDIADEMMWSGDPELLVNALVESGFMDNIDGVLHIHDFYEYVGKLVEKRKADAERKRNDRSKSKGNKEDVQQTSDGQVMDDPCDGAGNSTVQYSTLKETTTREAQIQILNLYCSLHNKLDIHVKPKDREEMMKLADSEITLEFILENMQKVFERSGEQIRGFGYYSPIIKDAWKNITSTSIPPKKEFIPEWKRKLNAQQRYENMEVARNRWISKGNDPDAFVYDPNTEY